MTKPAFDNLCRTRAHCRACRDRVGGRAWRAHLRHWYEGVPEGGDDFACPLGLAWGAGPEAPPRSAPAREPALARERAACCRACDVEACFVRHQAPCARRRILRDPKRFCPEGRWGERTPPSPLPLPLPPNP